MSFDWTGRSVTVTGGTGFIGGALVEELIRAGAKVRVLVRYSSIPPAERLAFLPAEVRGQVEIALGDLTDPETVAKAVEGADTVFHLGALIAIPYSYHAPRSYLRVNAEGTMNVLLGARSARRIVHLSTSEVYGTAQYVPMDEGHPINPQSPYAASKSAADYLALSFHRSFGTPVVTARPFNTYGPRQTARAVIPTIIGQALQGERVTLGATTPTRDFNFVSDTAAGLMKLAEGDAALGEVVNIGSGAEISIGAVVEKVAALLGKKLVVVGDEQRVRPAKSEVERLLADSGKIAALVGWKPRVSFDEGLERTLRWFQERPAGARDRYEL